MSATLETDRLASRMDAAAELCAAKGVRLTELRRDVLALILASEAPASAYDLLARLKDSRPGAAPPTVYRALDFLLNHGLVHRVERLGAFVGCPEPGHHAHPVHFLICRICHEAREMEDAALDAAVVRLAAGAGFAVERATVEIEGVCAGCAQRKNEAP
jgi:Fur family transcriptional regulator, zinc uptake regulator